MQISISKTLTSPFVSSSTQTNGAGQGPVFTEGPSVTPSEGPWGTVFTLSYGTVSPQSALISAVLTVGGEDVTQDVVLSASGMTYEAPLAGPKGGLVWQVKATTPSGMTLSSPATATVVSAQTTDVTMGGVTFRLNGEYVSGLDAAGKAYVVVPNGTATVVEITPAQTAHQGALVHGVMKNPQRTAENSPAQGYDGRFGTYDPVLTTSLPVSVTAGDVLMKTVARLPHENRKGAFDEIAALHVVSSPLPAGAFLGPSVQWAGQATPEWYPSDIEGLYSSYTRRSPSGMTFPPFDVLMQSLDQFYPLFAQISSANANGMGYENASPYGFGGGLGNYGRYMSSTIETAMLAVVTDIYSEAQTKAVLRRLVQHGIEWGDPLLYGPANYSNGPDGGHFQFHQGPVAVALAATGRMDALPLLMENAPGNWAQAIKIDTALLNGLADPDGPYVTRNRTLGPQPGGTVIRLAYDNHFFGPDWYQTKVPAGAQFVRSVDGVSALVPVDVALAAPNPKTGTIDVELNGPSPFGQGDVVRIEFPAGWIAEGLYDWTLRGLPHPHMFSPTAANEYRDLQNWGSIMALRAMGLFTANMEAVEGYLTRASLTHDPAPYNDYPAPVGTYTAANDVSYSVSPAFLNLHWSSLRAGGAGGGNSGGAFDPDVEISFDTALTPQAQATSMMDGVVIGIVPGAATAPVRLRGTASGVDEIEVRIRRQSGAVVQDWTPVAIAENGVWDGILNLPLADEWWAADARPSNNPTAVQTITEKFAVGYKIMWLGQSQMTLATQQDQGVAPLSPRAAGTASFYRWQAHNLRGQYAQDELLYVLDTDMPGSDAIRAFVDQFRAFDPDTPIQIMRASVNGSSILDLLDDGRDLRMWSDLTDKTDKYGGDVSVVIEHWNTSNTSALDGHQDIDLLNGINAHGFNIGHVLPDVLQPGYVYAVQPATRHSKAFNDSIHAASKIDRANELGFPVGFAMADYQTEDLGGPHALPEGQGNQFLGARMALLAAEALGFNAPEQPHFPTTARRSVDGTKIVLTPVLPNGGTLSSPTPENLTLFAVDYGTGLTVDGFTARIADNGTDVELHRTGGQTFPVANFIKVQAYTNGPLNPDLSGTTGQTPAQWRVLEEAIVDGQLYETFADDVTGRGLPVMGVAPNGVWQLTGPDMPIITAVTQEGAGPVQSALPVISEHTEADSSGAGAAEGYQRVRLSTGALLQDGTPPAAGSKYLIGTFQISAQSARDQYFDQVEVRDVSGAAVGETIEVSEIHVSPGGLEMRVQAFIHTDTGAGRDLYARTPARKLMSYLPVYKIDGFTTAGAVTATSSTGLVQLDNVPAGAAIVVFAQNRDGAGITWSGVVEDGAYSLNYDGADRYQAAASGVATTAGAIGIGADGAEEMVVVVLPPV